MKTLFWEPGRLENHNFKILATQGFKIGHILLRNFFQGEATDLSLLPIDAELKDLSDGNSLSENDLRNLRHSTRAVNRQPGYRPGRLVEPFSFRRRRERRRYTHTETQAHKKHRHIYQHEGNTKTTETHINSTEKTRKENTKQQNINRTHVRIQQKNKEELKNNQILTQRTINRKPRTKTAEHN